MSLALYRKYRSRRLDEIVGQKHITDILSRAIDQGRISHAYLLTGPRGVGKTSIARILAHEINNLPYSDEKIHLDIIEIDAASNNGVDDVRELRDRIQLAPVSANKKIYIIDEVHMLSKQAFNALLKTLEEPPEHVIFILATTDLDKLPATIVSRTQRFAFRPISTADATSHLKAIASKENIKVTDEALTMIAERGEGSFRDSISLLDQLSTIADEKKGITAELIESTLGLASQKAIDEIILLVEDKNLDNLIDKLEQLNDEGVDPATLSRQLVDSLRHKVIEKPAMLSVIDDLLEVPKSSYPYLKLMAVLGQAATAKQPPKSAALNTSKREITASVKSLKNELKKQNTEADASVDFDLTDLLKHVKQSHIAVHSVLSKCSVELEGNTLNIYTNNSFYKKKLDDPKYSSLIYEALVRMGHTSLSINTIPNARPPKDSQALAAFVIMGGGEEVSLDGQEGSTSWEGSAA